MWILCGVCLNYRGSWYRRVCAVEGSGVQRFLPAGSRGRLLASLTVVREGARHRNTVRATWGHRPLLSTGGCSMSPSPEPITYRPLSDSWGRRIDWQSDETPTWETQTEFEGRTEREICLLAKSYSVWLTLKRICMLHIFLFKIFELSGLLS